MKIETSPDTGVTKATLDGKQRAKIADAKTIAVKLRLADDRLTVRTACEALEAAAAALLKVATAEDEDDGADE